MLLSQPLCLEQRELLLSGAGGWGGAGGSCTSLFLSVIPTPPPLGRDRMMLLKLEQEILEFISDNK